MTEQQMLRSDVTDPSENEELWRNEIQARVARYKTRRGRRIEGSYTMRFPFPTAEEPAIEESGSVVVTEVESPEAIEPAEIEAALDPSSKEEPESVTTALAIEAGVAETIAPAEPADEVKPTAALERVEKREEASREFLLEPDPEPLPAAAPRPPVKRKIIAFPRQASNLEEMSRLADPVLPEQPRILDVPEELEPFPTTPLLEGLQLSAGPAVTSSPDHVELPAAPVTLSRRILAGAIDCGMVLIGCAVFGAVAYKMLPQLQASKTLLLGAATVPVLLWAVYEYLLLVYAGATLGMQLTRTRLSSFKGGVPSWRHRRSRAISLYFSAASLMMGVLWSLVDVDALCWHDRISHTYLTRGE